MLPKLLSVYITKFKEYIWWFIGCSRKINEKLVEFEWLYPEGIHNLINETAVTLKQIPWGQGYKFESQ